MPKEYKLIDLLGIRTYPLKDRFSKVSVKDAAKIWKPGGSFKGFLNTLPNILAGQDLKGLVHATVSARRKGRPVILGLGGHVIKVGLSPLIVDLMERGIVTALALHGAGAVHDLELSLIGSTSEEVEASLTEGAFGMAEETSCLINEAIKEGAAKGWGFGRALGEKLLQLKPPYLDQSLFAAGVRFNLPVTVHVAIGTDIFQMHPTCDGAALGEATHRDFLLLASVVADLGGGGVYLNVGSAVILPEVFLKALTLARNLGHQVVDFVTANFDLIQHYRPTQNVLRRPGGKSYALTGHHELLFPLFAAALLEGISDQPEEG